MKLEFAVQGEKGMVGLTQIVMPTQRGTAKHEAATLA